MPGVVASVAVAGGQGPAVKEGDLLLTIEAMKMETGIHADEGVAKVTRSIVWASTSSPSRMPGSCPAGR